MTNLPKVGERYRCFIVHREDRGWGGPYGMQRRPTVWICEECGYQLRGDLDGWSKARMADHHECGHSPCPACGVMLLLRKNGTPRQHAHNRCAGKTPGHKIEREFVKNMTTREMT